MLDLLDFDSPDSLDTVSLRVRIRARQYQLLWMHGGGVATSIVIVRLAGRFLTVLEAGQA